MSPDSRGVTILCLLTLVLEGYDVVMYGTVVPALLTYEPWHLTVSDVGWLGSILGVGMLVGALLAAGFGDRLGRRRTLLIAVTVFSAAMAVCGATSSYEMFAAMRFVVGVGTGFLMPTAAAAIVEYAPEQWRNRAVSLGFAGTAIGGIAAGLLSMWLIGAFGFRSMFWAGALPAVVLVPALWFLFPKTSADEARGTSAFETSGGAPKVGPSQVFHAAGIRATLSFWILMVLCLLLIFGTAAWLPKLMGGAGYSVAAALAFLLVLNIGALTGTLAGGWLADRFGVQTIITAGFLAAGLALFVLIFKPPSLIAYLLVVIAGAGTVGTQILLNAYVASSYPPSCRAAGVGLALGVGRLGAIAGPTYGGYVISAGAGYGWQLAAFAIPAVAAAAITLTVRVRQQESDSNTLPTDYRNTNSQKGSGGEAAEIEGRVG